MPVGHLPTHPQQAAQHNHPSVITSAHLLFRNQVHQEHVKQWIATRLLVCLASYLLLLCIPYIP